jgi:hypothetical protein
MDDLEKLTASSVEENGFGSPGLYHFTGSVWLRQSTT